MATTVTQINARKTEVDATVAAATSHAAALAQRVAAGLARPVWRRSLTSIDDLGAQHGHMRFIAERSAAESRKLARQAAFVAAGGVLSVDLPGTPSSAVGSSSGIPQAPSRPRSR